MSATVAIVYRTPRAGYLSPEIQRALDQTHTCQICVATDHPRLDLTATETIVFWPAAGGRETRIGYICGACYALGQTEAQAETAAWMRWNQSQIEHPTELTPILGEEGTTW